MYDIMTCGLLVRLTAHGSCAVSMCAAAPSKMVQDGLLDEKLACGCEITAGDVARAMVMLKVVRGAHAPKRDNRVDAVGYVLCLERAEPSDAGQV